MRLDGRRFAAFPLDRVEALRLAYAEARARGRARRGAGGVSRTKWRWSPPSGPRRRCCCNMVAEIDPDLPVLMIDSLMLFAETLEYQRDAVGASGAHQRAAPPARPDRPRAARSRRHAAPARHRRLLRRAQGGAARPGARGAGR